jgi:hypothetical protein
MQLGENTAQASSSIPPQNISVTAYGFTNVQSALRAAATSSPRAAPAYGNLAYLSDSSRRLYQHYINNTAEMLTRGPSLDGNPFIQYLLPLASHDQLVLNRVLAIGRAHVIINDTSSSHESARGLEVAARGHYAKVLSGIQKLLYYQTGHTVHAPEADTSPPTPSRVLLILLLLCVFDVSKSGTIFDTQMLTGQYQHVQGSSRSSIYHHLRASKEYVTLLTSDPNAPDELRNMRGFILELYAYHTMKLAITPRGLASNEFVDIDPAVHSLDVLSGYKSRGYLIGFGMKLFELMHLESAFNQDMLANPELIFEIEGRIDQMMPNFYTLFVSITHTAGWALVRGTLLTTSFS